jgi:hypothetical protein
MSETGHPAERRLVLRLLHYWRQIAGDRSMPSASNVAPDSIPDMWPNCFMLRFGASNEPVYDQIGSSFAPELANDLRGTPVGSTPVETLLRQATRYWDMVADKKVPISLGGEFRHRRGELILYRSIILPLSNDGARIDHLLGAANSRAVAVQ